MSPSEQSRPKASRIPIVAALLAGSVLLSRALGVVREMVLAAQAGAGAEVDAYRAAFQIPDILNHFLAGGAFAVAFVPIYLRVREQRGPASAERLVATTFGTFGGVAVVATALLWAFAPQLVALQFPKFAPETLELTVRVTRIVLPAQIFFVVGGLVRAVLMANDRFATQALAPVVYNLGIILGGVMLGGSFGVEGFAWGALVGAVLGTFGLPLLELRRARLSLGFRFAPHDGDFLAYLWRAAPLLMGVSLLTADEWFEKWFGGLLATGTVAQIGYARLLMLLPVAMVGQAVATAALPALSQLASEGKERELDATLLRILQPSLMLAVILGAALWAIAEPTVALIFERGRFSADDTRAVAGLLAILCFGIPGWVVQQVAGRGFYAREDMWRPMFLSTGVALLAIPLYLMLGRAHGASGIAAAGALAMSGSSLAMLGLLRWLHGGPELAPLFATALRGLAVAVPAALVGALAAGQVEPALLRCLVGGVAFLFIAIPGTWWLGDEATRELVTRLVQRLSRRGTAA